MKNKQRLIPLVLLQIIPLLMFPPAALQEALPVVGVVALVFIGLGIALYQGRPWALSLSIFLQGLNVIIRLMMLFPHAVDLQTGVDLPYIVLNVLAIALSGWFLFRLDQPDVRAVVTA